MAHPCWLAGGGGGGGAAAATTPHPLLVLLLSEPTSARTERLRLTGGDPSSNSIINHPCPELSTVPTRPSVKRTRFFSIAVLSAITLVRAGPRPQRRGALPSAAEFSSVALCDAIAVSAEK